MWELKRGRGVIGGWGRGRHDNSNDNGNGNDNGVGNNNGMDDGMYD